MVRRMLLETQIFLSFSIFISFYPVGILTDREVVELFLHYTVNPKPSVGFGDTPRCCLTGKEQVVSRWVKTFYFAILLK